MRTNDRKDKPRFGNVGELLKRARQNKGLSQMTVAKKLGYGSAQFVSNFERGISSPPLNKMRTLVGLYQLSVDDLMSAITTDQQTMLTQSLKDVRKVLSSRSG